MYERIPHPFDGEKSVMPPAGSCGQYDVVPPFSHERYVVQTTQHGTLVYVWFWRSEAIGGIGSGLGYARRLRMAFRAKVTKKGEISMRGSVALDSADYFSEAAQVVRHWVEAGRPAFYGERVA